ncbi:MAG: hypothetical protein L7S64_13010 [Longimicrobiales bacterium]|nr:hypothetical protein [Longimicrobiales bacterium]
MIDRALAALERSPWIGGSAAVMLAALAYAHSIGLGFAYDDVPIIRDNLLLHSLADWRTILGATWWPDALYRPFTSLTFALDWALSGGDPSWFHGVNVVLHAAVTALVFLLASGLSGPVLGTVAAALFAIHPVHVEAVANVVGRAELLAAAGAIGAVLLYRLDSRLARDGDRSWRRGCVFVATLVALLIALASKESAFVVPGLFLLVDWFDARSEGGRWGDTVRRHGGLWIAALALTAWWLWLWVGIQGDLSGARGKVAPGLQGAGLIDRLVAMAPVSLHYVRLLLVPAQLSADYSPDFLPVADGVTLAGVAGALVVVLSLAVAYSVRDRAAPVSLGIAWTAGSLLIVSNVLVPTEILLAERTLYLASVGTVIAVAWLLVLGLRRKPVVTSAVLGVMLVLGLARTAMRVPIWNDNETLFPQLIEDAPGSYRALWIGAILAYEGGDPTRGETLLREALQVHPLDEALWRDFGAQLQREGRWIEAGRAFSVAFDLAPVGRMSATQSILAYLQGGVVDSADAVADRAAITPQDDWRLRIAAADVAAARGRWQEAMELRASVARDLPTESALWLIAAEAAMGAQRCDEAHEFLERAEAQGAVEDRLQELQAAVQNAGCDD